LDASILHHFQFLNSKLGPVFLLYGRLWFWSDHYRLPFCGSLLGNVLLSQLRSGWRTLCC
jgi:hypothetical protein